MIHLDLFSGIGGFAYAIDEVFYEQKNEHIFVENDEFCQAVLKKHWPGAEINGDIRAFISDTHDQRKLQPERSESKERRRAGDIYILTGGFPCQPFSAAGRRRGTADDRYLWPAMFECISLFRPEWVIAENVRGLATWSNGLVLEQVCSDMEQEGYEVRPFIIPACAVNAPHRRDRIWIVAHKYRTRLEVGERTDPSGKGKKERNEPDGVNGERITTDSNGSGRGKALTGKPTSIGKSYLNEPDKLIANSGSKRRQQESGGAHGNESEDERRSAQHDNLAPGNDKIYATDTGCKRRIPGANKDIRPKSKEPKRSDSSERDWRRAWDEVATELCGVDDGLSAELDGLKLSKAGHRNARLKSLGNAIVPQVAMEILKAIKEYEK